MFRVNLILRLIASLTLLFIPLASLDSWIYDLFFRMRVPVSSPSDVVMIRVDDSDLLEHLSAVDPRFSPEMLPFDPSGYSIWHDDFYHQLIGKLEESGPSLIVFSTYYDWVQIDRLNYSNHSHSNKVLFSAAVNSDNKLIPPPRALTSGTNYGFNNLFPDGDSVIRKTHLIYSNGMSLALKAYQVLRTSPIQRDLVQPLFIDYRGRSGHYISFDGVAIAEGRIDASGVRGKVVVVGREEGRASLVGTPVGMMPKMEVLANTLDTFLQNREIRILPQWVNYAASIVCIGISVGVILTLPLNLSWLLQAVLAGGMFLVGLVAFSEFKIWFGLGNPLACILGTHLMVMGFRLGQQEEKQWHLTQESQYLKDMDQFKNNFISLFSHDLKTPIAKIKAITERLLGEHPDLPPKIRDSLKTLDKTNAELARFISDILKVTKMETMAWEPSREVVDLNRMVEDAVGRLRFLADEKRIAIVKDLEPLFSMEGDGKLLLEVIINLLENAIKYSPPDRKIIVRTREEAGVVRVSVIDEGPGIDPNEIPRVTGKFYRGKEVIDSTKGSGLGLYLAKYFVELHHGKLQIDSGLGVGTSASFTLPIP